jgi:hypothetical protein
MALFSLERSARGVCSRTTLTTRRRRFRALELKRVKVDLADAPPRGPEARLPASSAAAGGSLGRVDAHSRARCRSRARGRTPAGSRDPQGVEAIRVVSDEEAGEFLIFARRRACRIRGAGVKADQLRRTSDHSARESTGQRPWPKDPSPSGRTLKTPSIARASTAAGFAAQSRLRLIGRDSLTAPFGFRPRGAWAEAGAIIEYG